MNNDHAQDRYDPPAVGSDFEKDTFSEINPGVVFRLKPMNNVTQYRKINENNAVDVTSQTEIQFGDHVKVYVKS
jgi:hypothetical protein